MRKYQRKTNRGLTSIDELKRCAKLVLEDKISLRRVAKENGLCRMSLVRFIERYKQNPEITTFGYVSSRKVFTAENEATLAEYLLELEYIFHGIGPKEVQHFAYDYALKLKMKIPQTWDENKMAGKDWLNAFLRRNSRITLMKPDVNNRSKATAFNKVNVDHFFDKLSAVRKRYKFPASSIWNADKTGVLTFIKSSEIVVSKGKQDKSTSYVGTYVALILAISASGSGIPPMFLFPIKEYHEHFIQDGPPDSVGMGNFNGYVTRVDFFGFMQHFIKHVKPCKDSPVLLIIDNNPSCISINTLELAKENGVVMLSFPLHCSDKLQPLDVAVFGALKSYLASAQEDWTRNHPDENITIYDIPAIVRKALPLAFSPTNIIDGFKATGIVPLNQRVFQDGDYAIVSTEKDIIGESITMEIEIKQENEYPERSNMVDFTCISLHDNQEPSTSRQSYLTQSSRVFPNDIVPSNESRDAKKSCKYIIAGTPEEDELTMKQAYKNRKLVQKEVFQREFESDDEDYFCMLCCEAFFECAPGEDWAQCDKCKEWAEKKIEENRLL